MLPELPVAAPAISGLRCKELQLSIGVKWSAVAFLEFRFVIERVYLTHASRAENLDDTFGFRHVVYSGIGFGRCDG